MYKRKWTAEERRQLAAGEIRGGFAGPSQSYPIASSADVADAWGLAGRASNPDAIRRRIIQIAKKFGWTGGLPDTAKEWAAERGIDLKALTFGDHLKAVALTDDWLVVENHIVLFGGHDLEGEYFEDDTDLESDYTRSVGRLPIDFEHGQKVDGPLSPGPNDVLGYTDWTTAEKTQHGWLVQSMLNRRNQYVKEFEPLIAAGLVGTSSEAVPDLVEVAADGHIRRWPLRRNSLTVTPMEPRMLGNNALAAYKSLQTLLPEYIIDLDDVPITPTDPSPQDGEETMTVAHGAQPTAEEGAGPKATIKLKEQKKMTEEVPAVTADEFKALNEVVMAQTNQINQILELLTSNPKALGVTVAPDSTNDHPGVKSFGDFLIAVMRNNEKRLTDVYGIKDLSGNIGIYGGILVPEDYSQQILQAGRYQSEIVNLVTGIPTTREAGKIPALDQYITPTAGSGETAYAAGIKLEAVEAGGLLAEQNLKLTQIEWRLNKMGGFVDVENELLSDSPFAIDALLTNLFAMAHAAKVERNILRGTGAGEPLGIVNWPGLISVTVGTSDTFAAADAGKMLARFKRVSNNVRWLMHPSLLPDCFAMVSAPVAWLNNYTDSPNGTLYGIPILETEHLPQADSANACILADLGAYLYWYQQTGLAVAYSEHVSFKNDMGCWRFIHRNDGKPWLKNYITLGGPGSAYTVSPFVAMDD